MLQELANNFRPIAPPQVFAGAYTNDQYRRLMNVVRRHGPWQLILAENFERPEEVIATTSGELPEGVELTWDMLLKNPVFRGMTMENTPLWLLLTMAKSCLFRD